MRILFYLMLLAVISLSKGHALTFPQNIQADPKNLLPGREVPAQYHQVAMEVKKLFHEDIARQGATLHVRYKMDNTNVNAYASRENNKWFITFYGGMIRHRSFDKDVFATIVCHELGHHLGKAPYKFPDNDEKKWVSAEGQSDYFATNICLKRLYENKNNESFLQGKDISTIMRKGCRKNFQNQHHYYLCLRNSILARKTGVFTYRISGGRRGNRNKFPRMDEPNDTIVTRTKIDHPDPQCRMDTYFQGALCVEYFNDQTSGPNCENMWSQFSGARPRCWFAPKEL